jgi:uncharacterized protein YhaN
MTLSDYYQILGLTIGSSENEIKKAYRQKARLYHPDINPSPDAKDKFIMATEAYEFLIANLGKIYDDEAAYRQSMNDWRKYRQDRSKQRARAYAQTSYSKFRNTDFYKTTRILDGTTVAICLVVSAIVLLYTIIGYIYTVRHPDPRFDKPTIFGLIMLLTLGMILFGASLIYFKAFKESSKKHKRKSG